MAYIKNGSKYYTRTINAMINEKMIVLEDFGICGRYDKTIREKLKKAIEDKPEKDPREVIDYICRPWIHSKINSWI